MNVIALAQQGLTVITGVLFFRLLSALFLWKRAPDV